LRIKIWIILLFINILRLRKFLFIVHSEKMKREIPFQKRSRLLSKRDCHGTLLTRSINQQIHRESYSILLKHLEKFNNMKHSRTLSYKRLLSHNTREQDWRKILMGIDGSRKLRELSTIMFDIAYPEIREARRIMKLFFEIFTRRMFMFHVQKG